METKIQTAINDQINAELWSAYLYLSMSLEAEKKGFPGIANWFWIQWLEEQDHARILQKYLADSNSKVNLKPIDKVPTEWKNIEKMYEDTLIHEQKVTAMINNLVDLSREAKDNATLSRLQWFVDEQVEEEAEANRIIDMVKIIENNSGAMFFLDKHLGSRKYQKASALQ